MYLQQQPLVSVLMTAYNREKYIVQAIESVLASTYKNFELIIVDDCSKDKTVEIAKSYAQKDSRLKVYVNEKNLGDYPNRNKAASYAAGKYLKYIDSDDYIYPWGLELLVQMMEEFPEAGWGLCSLIQAVEKPYPFQLSSKEAYEYNYFGPGLFFKAPLSSVFNRIAFEKAGGFSNMRMVSDVEMWHKMALSFPVVLMPDGIVWYREHDSQEVNSKGQFILHYEQIIFRYLQAPLCPLTKDQIKNIIKKRRYQFLKYTIYYLFSFRFKISHDNFRIWWFYFGK